MKWVIININFLKQMYDSGKLEIIIDILNSNGDIIDGEEIEVSIDDVLPVK